MDTVNDVRVCLDIDMNATEEDLLEPPALAERTRAQRQQQQQPRDAGPRQQMTEAMITPLTGGATNGRSTTAGGAPEAMQVAARAAMPAAAAAAVPVVKASLVGGASRW